MQKGSQSLQSLQDKKRNYLKDACACGEATHMLRKEMEERKAFFEGATAGRLHTLQAGEERRGSCASQSNGCCFDPAMLLWQMEQVFACGAARAERFIRVVREVFWRRFKAPAAPDQMAGGEEQEDWEGDWDDEKAANRWYEGATVDPAVDPARCQDANGGSFGGGNPSTPRSGMRVNDSSRSPRGKQDGR